MRSSLSLALLLLGLLVAFPISTVKTAGTLQEGKDAAAYNALGLELSRTGKIEGAIAAFKQAIKLKKDYAEAYYNLGNVYFRSAEFKKAVDAYKQAVRYQPEWAEAYNNMGTGYYKLREFGKAIDAYKAAIRLNPKDAIQYYNLSVTYLERGNERAAIEQYKIVKAIDPAVAEKLYLLIYKPMATVYDSSVVRLRVIATDSGGTPRDELGNEDFQVLEDDAPQTLSSLSKGEAPLVYGLTVDNSGSIRSVLNFVIEACKSIIKNNLTGDETLLIRFVSSDKIETLQEFTSDQNVLTESLDSMYVEAGQSAILDAVYLSAQRVAQYNSQIAPLRRAVILVTDGEERASYYAMEDVLKLLRKIDVRLFAISVAKTEQYQKLTENQLQRSIDLLTKLANETGGQAFFPKSLPELQTQIKQMMTLIRSEYVLEYKTSGSAVAGTYRRVSVNIVPKPGREAWQVLTRPGYLVAEKPPER